MNQALADIKRHWQRLGMALDMHTPPRALTSGGTTTHQQKERTMKVNEGTVDRALRVLAGLALIGLAATGKVGVWGYIGVVPLLTGAVGMCPLYSILGINTCAISKR
jgi:hypothetical protein